MPPGASAASTRLRGKQPSDSSTRVEAADTASSWMLLPGQWNQYQADKPISSGQFVEFQHYNRQGEDMGLGLLKVLDIHPIDKHGQGIEISSG